jgi:hypothetical protein
MDSTGYTERQAARNKKLLEEILGEIRSLKSAVSEIRLEVAKLNQIENKIKKGEVLANSNGGWFWFSS